MRVRHQLPLLPLILLGTGPLLAQERTVTLYGTVGDESYQLLAGVTVLLDGSVIGQESDAAGAFTVPGVTAGAHVIALRRTRHASYRDCPGTLIPLAGRLQYQERYLE